jgi:hypothetical protein
MITMALIGKSEYAAPATCGMRDIAPLILREPLIPADRTYQATARSGQGVNGRLRRYGDTGVINVRRHYHDSVLDREACISTQRARCGGRIRAGTPICRAFVMRHNRHDAVDPDGNSS